MNFTVKNFDELSKSELVEIYQIRLAIFVVEQNCPFQEIDDYDAKCIHIYARDNNKIIAYCRILPAGCTFDTVAIGRVLCTKRRQGIATKLLEKAIEVAKEKYNPSVIKLEAQVYAKSLYEKVGFVQSSNEFLEDDIPHIEMSLKLK